MNFTESSIGKFITVLAKLNALPAEWPKESYGHGSAPVGTILYAMYWQPGPGGVMRCIAHDATDCIHGNYWVVTRAAPHRIPRSPPFTSPSTGLCIPQSLIFTGEQETS